jgi:DNA repair ATPase RecN
VCNACESSRLSNRNTQLITSKVHLVSKIDNILSVVEEIKSSVSKHEIALHDVNSKLSTVSKQLHSLVDRTSSLECRLDSVEIRLPNVKKTKSYTDETIINEVLDRQSRSRNLIVFNVADQTNNTRPTTWILLNLYLMPYQLICSRLHLLV